MTAREVMDLLLQKHADPLQWVCVPEFSIETGWGLFGSNRIDLYVLNCWPSKQFQKVSYEIKVSRSDFLADIKNTSKHVPARMVSDEFYFVAPSGLVKYHEVPDYAGLLEVEDGRLIRTKRSPHFSVPSPSWGFVASLSRRLKRMEPKP